MKLTQNSVLSIRSSTKKKGRRYF